jgi:hypothetical protein
MTPTVETPRRGALIECSSLSDEERVSLEAFLQKQPDEVRSVDHRQRIRNPAPVDPETLGMLFHLAPVYHLALQFADHIAEGLTVVYVQKWLEAWWKGRGVKKRKKRKKPHPPKTRSAEQKTLNPELLVVEETDEGEFTVVKIPKS